LSQPNPNRRGYTCLWLDSRTNALIAEVAAKQGVSRTKAVLQLATAALRKSL
jgi:hypothetical protein